MSIFSQPGDLSLLGTDLATSAEGDVAANGRDWAVISGVENVINAFIRELVTPLGYIARYVYDIEGLKILDEDYGNAAYAQLSAPMTPEWVNSMVSHITSVANVQSRLQLKSVEYTVTNLSTDAIKFYIVSTIPSVPKPFNLILQRTGNTLTAGLGG